MGEGRVAAGDVVDVAGIELVGPELIEDVAVVSKAADRWAGAGAVQAAEGGEADGVSEVGEVDGASVEDLRDGPVSAGSSSRSRWASWFISGRWGNCG